MLDWQGSGRFCPLNSASLWPTNALVMELVRPTLAERISGATLAAGLAPPHTNPLLQRLPFQVLQGNKRWLSCLSDLVDGANIGMVECRSGAGFALEAPESL